MEEHSADAYEKADKHRKDKGEMIDATKTAFIYTLPGSGAARRPDAAEIAGWTRIQRISRRRERRRSSAKVQGVAWIDEQANQLAKGRGRGDRRYLDRRLSSQGIGNTREATSCRSDGSNWHLGFGSRRRYAQYDFDGRRLFMSFSVHEKTFYSQYKRIGPPKEALAEIRAGS